MINIDVKQKSPEWLEWRKKGISATDSVIILGASPYKTPWRLWAEKTGLISPEDLSGNPHVARGNAQEDDARKAFEDKYGGIFFPHCCEWSKNPIFRASLDGYDDYPVELKCPSDKTWQEVCAEGTNSAAFKMYVVQLQHQIMVTDSEFGYLAFYKEGEDEEIQAYKVERDDEVIDQIIQKGTEFWDHVINGTEPDKDPERDNFLPKGEDALAWKQAAESYLSFESKIKSLKESLKSLESMQNESKKQLTDLLVESGFNHCEIEGVKVTSYITKGRVSYDKLITDLGVDEETIEKYRGKDRTSFRVTAQKEGTVTLEVEQDSDKPVKEKVVEKQSNESLYW